jgi:LPS export ABC transporter permease LptG
VLVVFGVLTKNNEVTAFKACGVSMYRLTVPILAGGFLLSGGLFAFDHYWVPEADRIQDAIRAEIKGRPAQTYLNPGRTWFYGLEDRIFYYKYFDQKERVMLGVNVFEIDPETFRLKKHIAAERARWEPALNAWVFQNGWSWDLKGHDSAAVFNFAGGIRVFPELKETPDYFGKRELQSHQMNFLELGAYIDELQQSGFDTIPLQVQLYKKFSVPLFAFILALVSAPFAFLAGNRGGMAGIGMSFVIFIAYVSVDQLFEQLGNLNELPPQLAAWSPDVVFTLVGLYFLARMRT